MSEFWHFLGLFEDCAQNEEPDEWMNDPKYRLE
jgi:hypothetical protein